MSNKELHKAPNRGSYIQQMSDYQRRSLTLASATLAVALLNFMPMASAGEDLLGIYELAVENDLDFQIANEQHKINLDGLVYKKSLFKPKVNFGSGYNRNLSDNKSINDAYEDPVTGQIKSVTFGSSRDISHANYGLRIQQPLFNLRDWFTLKTTKLDNEMHELTLASEQQQLIMRVVGVYMAVLRARNDLESNQAELDAVIRQMERSERQYNVGEISSSAVDTARSRLDAVRLNHLEVQIRLQERREDLAQIIGDIPDSLIGLQSGFTPSLPVPADVNSWVAKALDGNNAYKQSGLRVQTASYAVKSDRFKSMPMVNLAGNYSKNHHGQDGFGIDDGSTRTGYASVGITVTMPIYDGGTSRAQSRQTHSLYRQATYRHKQQERFVISSTKRFFNRVQSSIRTIEVLKAQIASEQKFLNSTRRDYEDGIKNLEDLLNAEQGLIRTRNRYRSSRYDYILASLNLKQHTGTLSPQDVIELNVWFKQEDTE